MSVPDEETLEEEWLTVAEAAACLSVSERTVYRLLKSDNFAARTVTERRQTATGKRKTTLIPAALLNALAAEIAASASPVNAESNADNFAANNDGNGDTKPANNDGRTLTDGDTEAIGESPQLDKNGGAALPGTLPALLYQRQIAAMETQNAELKADKERLYALLEQAQANLQREQSLRLLTHTETREMTGPQTEATPENSEPISEIRKDKKGFWARLWQRGGK